MTGTSLRTRRSVIRAGGVGLGSALAGCTELTGTVNQESSDRPIQAHRCFAEDNPENTLLAAREATAVADQLEFDVRRCGSGELVVFHDERVDDKTDGSGAVADLPLSELRDLRVLESDQHVPSLREMLAEIPTDVAVNVELKEHDIASDVRDVVGEFEHRTILSAIRPTVVQQADRAREDDEYEVALVGVGDPSRGLETAVAMHCDRIHLGFQHLVETDALEVARDTGLWVHTGTLHSATQYEIARDLPVDGFSGDTAEIFQEGSE